MWPFKAKQTASVTASPELETLIRDLVHRIDNLESKNRTIHQEWADTLDKLQTWFGREAARRRQRVHRALEGEPEGAPEAVGAMNGAPVVDKAELRRIAAQRRFNGRTG